MQPQTYKMLAEREDSYWWHIARRAMSQRLLRGCGIPVAGRWLDLGCGPGGNLALAEPFAPGLVVGLDVAEIALALARRKKPTALLVRADLNNVLPFAAASFDVVIVFNVLYHGWVNSEAAVLAEIHRVLRPGGVLLLTEPAFSALTREMDHIAMGRRRYRIGDFVRLCDGAGLRVLRASYFTSFGYPLLLGLKLLRRLKQKAGEPAGRCADMKPLNRVTNFLLRQLASLEARAIAAGLAMPVGTTLLCLAQKDR